MSATPDTDDVVDKEFPSGQPLHDALVEMATVLTPPYQRADQQAMNLQTLHKTVVVSAAWLGFAAICGALAQFIVKSGQGILDIDLICAVFAGAAVLLGVVASWKKRWFLQRHRAERLRLFKYRALLELVQSSDTPEALVRWKAHLRAEVARIENTDWPKMMEWAEVKNFNEIAPFRPVSAAENQTLQELREYYTTKRLEFQMDYFYRKAEQYELTDQWLRILPPALFLVGIAFALVHFLLGYRDLQNAGSASAASSDHTVSLSLIFIVASVFCVVLSSTIRVIRSANEYARNTGRFRAKYFALTWIANRFGSIEDSTQTIALWSEAEQILEEEHREWLRLMVETEWFG